MGKDNGTPRLEWTEDLSVGVDSIDAQHRAMFDAINDLVECLGKGGDDVTFHRLLDFLESYTREHFADEEKYMEKYEYPRFDDHIEQHRIFTEVFEDFRGKFDQGGASGFLLLHAQKWLFDWLLNHIRAVDKEFGGFLKPRLEDR